LPTRPQPRKTVFLDRDGVICHKAPEGDYIKSWDEFVFLPLAKESLALLTAHGFHIIVISNQRGVARGFMTEDDLAGITRRMRAELAPIGARLDGVYYCPHEAGTCDCRKPGSGLLERARNDFPDIDFQASYVIGDSVTDLQAGAPLGCAPILIASGEHRRDLLAEAARRGIVVQHVAASLYEAALRLISDEA